MEDYRSLNRAHWDERAPAHAASPGYAVARFAEDPGYISHVVAFDVPRLGDVNGVRGAHLQCHIGTDTVSLARLGARMTGLDFSPPALEQARRLAESAGVEVDFVEGNLYDAVEVLGASSFDLVFTGIGALCWLPDINAWGGVVAGLLRPGGRLFLRETHPVLWALGERDDGLLVLEYPYFEIDEPNVFDSPFSYVETTAPFTQNVTNEWNHGLAEIITSLLEKGMHLTSLVEHDSVPYEAFPGQMEHLDNGEWRLRDRPWRLPHTYTLQAVKGQ
jgi:SAM-dependent methyltransferase